MRGVPEAEHNGNGGQDIDEDDPEEAELPLVEVEGGVHRVQEEQRELAQEGGQVDEQHLREASTDEVVLGRKDRGAQAAHEEEHNDAH